MKVAEDLREALEYAVGLSEGQDVLFEVNGKNFYNAKYARLEEVEKTKYPEPIVVNSLTSLVGYLKSELDRKKDEFERLLIHVIDPTKVAVLSELDADQERRSLIVAQANLDRFSFGRFMDQESFKISIQSMFKRELDADAIMKFASAIKIEDGTQIKDNGISQTATVKSGASTYAEGEVPSPATLRPFRTFLEVEQPASQFVFRIQEGPKLALFEADGGMWRYEAMQSVKDYLVNELKADNDLGQIIVIA